jgi:hypothetical protein
MILNITLRFAPENIQFKLYAMSFNIFIQIEFKFHKIIIDSA